MFRYFLPLAAVALLCTGCMPARFKTSYKSVKGDPDTTLGSVFVWDNDVSAAVAYPPGKSKFRPPICMQRAMTAGATSVNASGSVSDAIVKLANPAVITDGKQLASATVAASNAVMALSVSTERTAYLDTGLFYLCQMHANGALNDNLFYAAVTKLIDRSATMTTAAASLGQLAAPLLPTPTAIVQESAKGKATEPPEVPKDPKPSSDGK
jgi:hypothetical protein